MATIDKCIDLVFVGAASAMATQKSIVDGKASLDKVKKLYKSQYQKGRAIGEAIENINVNSALVTCAPTTFPVIFKYNSKTGPGFFRLSLVLIQLGAGDTVKLQKSRKGLRCT